MTTVGRAPRRSSGKGFSGRHPRRSLESIGAHLVLSVAVLIAVVPVVLIVMNSFKDTMSIFSGPLAPPTPETFSLKGYEAVLSDASFGTYYRNSLIVTLASLVLTLTFSAMCAFAISEYRVRLAPIIAGFLLIGVMVPIRLATVPLLQMMVSWKLFNTHLALILVYTGMSLPVAVAIMLVSFRTVPRELKDAARIDGASEFRTFRLVLPLVRPAIAAVATVSMLPMWNDLWFPLILAPGEATQTVTLGTQQFAGQFQKNWPALLAALTVGALPLIILFTAFSRQFIRGLSQGFTK